MHPAKPHWLNRDTIGLFGAELSAAYRLYRSPTGGLNLEGPGGLIGCAFIPLSVDPTGPGPKGCDENGSAAALLVGHVSVQIGSLYRQSGSLSQLGRVGKLATQALIFSHLRRAGLL